MRKLIVTEFFNVDGMMSDPGDTMKRVMDNISARGGVYQSKLYGSVDTLLFGRPLKLIDTEDFGNGLMLPTSL